jgi:hypothetical protein
MPARRRRGTHMIDNWLHTYYCKEFMWVSDKLRWQYEAHLSVVTGVNLTSGLTSECCSIHLYRM